MARKSPEPTELGMYLLRGMVAKQMTTQTDLAKAAGLSRTTITQVIYTDIKVTRPMARALASALDLPYEYVAYLGGCLDVENIEPISE